MKQLKEPKATEREVKKTARVTSAERMETESIGELFIPSIKTNQANVLYRTTRRYSNCKIYFQIIFLVS